MMRDRGVSAAINRHSKSVEPVYREGPEWHDGERPELGEIVLVVCESANEMIFSAAISRKDIAVRRARAKAALRKAQSEGRKVQRASRNYAMCVATAPSSESPEVRSRAELPFEPALAYVICEYLRDHAKTRLNIPYHRSLALEIYTIEKVSHGAGAPTYKKSNRIKATLAMMKFVQLPARMPQWAEILRDNLREKYAREGRPPIVTPKGTTIPFFCQPVLEKVVQSAKD